jgi:hypothetical protein
MLTATHTHSAPQASRLEHFEFRQGRKPNASEQAYYHLLVEAIAGCVIQATANLKPATVWVDHRHIHGISSNRRHAHGPVDTSAVIIRVDDGGGNPIAVACSFACHPTVLPASNYLISADFPGQAAAMLEAMYPQCTFLYLQGAAGDISTRYVRRASDYTECQRLGRILAGETLAGIYRAKPVVSAPVAGAVVPWTLRVRDFGTEEELQAMVSQAEAHLEHLRARGAPASELRTAYVTLQGAKRQIELKRTFNMSELYSQVQALRIGDIRLIGVPVELFAELGMAIAQTGPGITRVVGYANDSLGYIPTSSAYTEGGYELGVTLADASAGESLLEKTKAALALV